MSIQRINEYLNASEIDPENINHFQLDLPTFKRSNSPDVSRPVVKVKDGAFSWLPEDPIPTLQNINFEIKQGQLVALVGGVGSGKSSLMSALLGEMDKLRGTVEIRNKIAFVPQEAWIRNATIRENIILNKVFDEKKYKAVLETCALGLDLAIFEFGDQTEIGEKGINLSGGQKQRISIARAVYSNADIFILDDPLRYYCIVSMYNYNVLCHLS